MDLKSIFLGFLVGFGVPCLLHLIGFFLLYCVKMRLVNQRLILLNVAASECFASFMQIVEGLRFVVFRYPDFKILGKPYCYAERFFIFFSHFGMRIIMLYLIFDRFLDIHLGVRYAYMFHQGIVKKVIASLWLIAAIFAVSLNIIFQCKAEIGIWFALFALDSLEAIVAAVTYIYFYFKVRASIKFRKQNAAATSKNGQRK